VPVSEPNQRTNTNVDHSRRIADKENQDNESFNDRLRQTRITSCRSNV